MRIEKFVNSKFYRVFEWFYRLVFLNLIVLLISFSLAAIPFLIYLENDDGLLVIIGVVLFIILFIPSSITSFIVIKHYLDEQTGNVFVLYYKYFIDTLKRIYIIEIIFLPIFFLTIYGLYFWWVNLGPDNFQNNIYGVIAVIAFVVEFFITIGLLFMFLNLMFLFSYFRMRTKDYLKLAFKFSIRNMAQTLFAAIILLLPVILLNLNIMKLLPLYFIAGITLPEYIIALMIRNRFGYLSRNLEELNN